MLKCYVLNVIIIQNVPKMNIQFRTRSKSTIDYSPELKSLGVCCDVEGNKSQKTFLECFESGGNFQYGSLEEINCPTVGATGCCCSCIKDNLDNLELYGNPPNYECNVPISLLTTGLRDNVTECECTRIGGKWTSGVCPSGVTMSQSEAFYRCMKEYPAGTIKQTTSCNFDVRVPRSCCYIYTDSMNIPLGITCSNVCTEQDCESLSSSTYSSVYSPGKICNGSLISGNDPTNCVSNNIASLMVTKMPNETNESYGSCFELINENTGYTLSISFSTKNNCKSGYWVKTQGDLKIAEHLLKPSIPTKEGIRLIEPEIMTISDFENLKLNVGDFYKGGIYVGIYEIGSPNSTTSSNLYIKRSENITKKTLVKSTSNGNGEKNYKKWVLLLEPQVYVTTFVDFDENYVFNANTTSLYDGFYNCYGDNQTFYGLKTNLLNSITGKNRKGFYDFYIPSIFELQYFTNQYSNYKLLRDTITMSKLSCMTSSFRTNNLIYSQYLQVFDQANYGAEIISSTKQKLSMLLFRKIILT